tara:strand:- start:96 stop:536 length:441 start_codon:yes stop_codon:yes gene_type:complete
VSKLFKRKLQRLAEGRGPACLSLLLDGWPATQAPKLGEITLSQIMPCVTAPDEEEEEEEEEGGLQRGEAPRRWRDNGRPWAAGGKHAKAFKKERNEKEFWAPGGRQSGVHKRKAGRAYAIQFSDGAERIAAKPKRGRPNHRSSRSR